MRRLALLLAVLATLSAPAPAPAQNNPFGPLPPPVPEATPVPERPENPDEGIDPRVMLFVAAGVLLAFVAMGVYITRDARRSLTESDREALDRTRDPSAGSKLTPAERRERARAKQRARAKGRAQRQARKAGRKR